MKKRILLLFCLIAMPAMLTIATESKDGGGPLPLSGPKIDPTEPQDPHPKSPAVVPIIYQDGHELVFDTKCDGCTLRIVDANDDVVYSIVIPAGTTSLVLPSFLSGTYELQIVRDGWLFYGDITL